MADNILSRGMKIDSRCQICGLEGESSNHVLFSCTWARQLMSDRSVSSQFTQSIPWLLWLLWKNRNDFLFEGRMSTTSNLMEKSQKEASDWLQVQMIEVLLHSRKSSCGYLNAMDAKLCFWTWAVESMSNLKIRRVILVGQEEDIIGMIKRPIAWPSFKFHSSTLSDMLTNISQWRMVVEEKRCNKGAFLIARSVTMEDR
ncbi:hypothetical protein DY000_02003720 [Brassica cretica]|uniref:Reverse transcriptase zinc-binding domain-containing protein n=1 Tax=Brassica cretica TaxID=69181 RepID=A0ABQ7BVC8_BRACR|nr:hypothetical protein DY000_02003720 [Brassica cretica]